MPYYRVTYEGYTEGQYDTKEEAIKEFIEQLGELPENYISIEEYDEEKQEWK